VGLTAARNRLRTGLISRVRNRDSSFSHDRPRGESGTPGWSAHEQVDARC
jgi:hypothetical protein